MDSIDLGPVDVPTFEGFRKEILEVSKGTKLSRYDAHWWAGYAMGLFVAGQLTQKEHDAIVTLIADSSVDVIKVTVTKPTKS